MPPLQRDTSEDCGNQPYGVEHTPTTTPEEPTVLSKESSKANNTGTNLQQDSSEDGFLHGDVAYWEMERPTVAASSNVQVTGISADKVPLSNRPTTAGKKASKSRKTPVPLPDAVLKKYGKVAKLQDRFLAEQSRVRYARDIMAVRLDSFKESLASFMEFSVSQAQHDSETTITETRANTYNRLLNDTHAVEEQMLQITDLEQSLGELEYRLAKAQPKLLKLIDNNLEDRRRHPKRSPSLSSIQPSSSSTGRRAVSPPLQPLQRDYYKKRGEVRLLHDKLFNLQARIQKVQAEGSSPPTLEALDDDNSPKPFPAVQDQLLTKSQKMEQQLQEQELELKRLWKACKEAGFNVGSLGDELSWTPHSMESKANLPSEPAGVFKWNIPPFMPQDFVPRFLKDFRWPQREDFVAPTLPQMPDLGGTWNNIEKWLQMPSGIDAVFAQPMMPSTAAEFEHFTSIPKSESGWVIVRRASTDVISINESGMLSTDDNAISDIHPWQHRSVRKVLRKWKSDEVLKSSSGRNHPIKRGSADVY